MSDHNRLTEKAAPPSWPKRGGGIDLELIFYDAKTDNPEIGYNCGAEILLSKPNAPSVVTLKAEAKEGIKKFDYG